MTVDYFAELGKRNRWPDMKDLDEVTTHYHTLIATGHKKDKDGADALRAQWNEKSLLVTIPEPDDVLWQPISAPTPDLTILPAYSFSLRFMFRLAQPYLSKDDNDFYIIDNPIVRDKVFRLPIVRPSSWKGNLRAALRQLGHQDDGPIVQRLFGKVNEPNDAGHSGRLIFFPTFFTQTGLEIINPHDRKTKVGKNPILFECVPQKSDGTFTLLYVPFDRIGDEDANSKRKSLREEVAEDIKLVAQGLRAMFTEYGFGAKTSSGFGLAEDRVIGGIIQINIIETEQQALPPQETLMPEALQAFLQEFPDEDFSLKPNAWRKQHNATTSHRNQYKEARSAFDEYHKVQKAYEVARAEWEAQAKEPAQRFLEASFETFTGLAADVAKSLATKLTTEGVS